MYSDPSPHAVRPLDLVDVLEQLSPDVVGTMVLGQLDSDDIRSFKLVAPSTLALVRRTSRVLHLGRFNTQQQTFLSRIDLESQSKILAQYEACMEVQMDVATTPGISPLLVGHRSRDEHNLHATGRQGPRTSPCKIIADRLHAAILRLDVGVTATCVHVWPFGRGLCMRPVTAGRLCFCPS